MSERKENRPFTFTVEGETEKWYLEWLEERINEHEKLIYNVSISSRVQQKPMKFAKTVNPRATPEVTHWCDYESNEDVHITKFKDIIKQLKESSQVKNIKYKLGYSNFTFELWIVLHKQDCNGSCISRDRYLASINRAYGERFENLDQYKHEDNFKRCLRKLSINDVFIAIERAKSIMNSNKINGLVMQDYKGFKYYSDNPSLTIYESVEKILKTCLR